MPLTNQLVSDYLMEAQRIRIGRPRKALRDFAQKVLLMLGEIPHLKMDFVTKLGQSCFEQRSIRRKMARDLLIRQGCRRGRLECVGHCRLQGGRVERFIKVPAGPQVKSLSRCFSGRICGHHQDGKFRAALADCLEDIEPIKVWKRDIQEDQIRWIALDRRKAISP